MRMQRKKPKVVRSLLSIVLLLAMLAQLAVPVFAYEIDSYKSSGETSVTYGDVNSDGTVNSTDVDLLARYLAADTSVTIDHVAADVDKNGSIDLNDLLFLVKYVKGDTNVSLGETVTVTFDTKGGNAIDPITVVVGSTITTPKAEKDNAIFLGWFTDEAFTTPFYSSDPITDSITVYAKYADVNGEPEYTPSAFALMDQSKDLIFTIERVSGELAPVNAVTLVSADGSVAPKLVFTEVGEGKWNVSADGGYTEGASYILTLAEGYNFADKDASIREASFFIKKEEIANFTTNEDIIYIRDTASMTYTLADGTVCEVLDSAVLYNSEDVITGSFSYTGGADIDVGDTLCIYVTTSPTERDYINGNYDNDPTAYIVVETISGSTVTFRGMTMQGENSDVEKLISMPSTIPFSVLNLPEGNGTVDFADRDLAALITMYNTGAPESVKVGDFLAFYVGNFGSLRDGDTVYYKRVTAVNGTTITYVESSQEELLNAINLFLASDVEGDKMIENIDQGQLETQVMQQVEETGFAEDALKYLSSVVTSSDEFYDYVADNKIVVYDENGVKLTEEQIKAYGLGNSFELADDVELSFNITTCDGENSHFENGIKVTLTIGAEFEVDIGKDGKMGSLKIELGAAFTQEVCIDVNVNATADITWIVCIPKINDIVFSSAVDVMSYTGVSIEAKFYTQEASEDFFDKLEENWGDKLGEDTMKKIKEFKKKYEDKFDEDSLGEDIEGFFESQTALIEDLIQNGEITKEQAESCLESHSENHIVQTFFSKAHLMNDEDYNAGITELAERYAEMLGEEDNGWLELCKIKIFDIPINLWIFQISIEGNFVVRANVNIALGANLEYEIGKRYVNWFSIFGNGSGAEEIDLIDERFAFQFYAMGHVGLKAGILIEIKVGIISTKIGNVGISAEVGAFAELYGYFQYTYTKTRPAGGIDWEEEETLMGALYFEFGLYVDINVKAELLSILEKSWEVYSEKWTLLSAGSKSNIYGFATELEDGEKIVVTDKDSNSTNGIHYQLSEDFRSMKTLDMVSGDQDNVVKPWVSYYGYNFWGGDDYSLTQHEDKVNFTYTLSSQYFSLVPVYEEKDGKQYIVDYEIQVDVPENVHYLTCDLRLVWTLDKLCWSKYDMAITIPLVWTDLADEELTEYRTATVKVGNEQDGYRTVWSERYIKGATFELPSAETILKLADYAGNADVRYSGYTGYTRTNRGDTIENVEQSMLFDTIYYFDMTTREYSITVKDVQNTNGSTKNMTFRAKYGEKFDFSALIGTGTESGNTYTIFSSLEAKDASGAVTLIDPTGEIKGNFASALLADTHSYHAKYVRNCGEVTYRFDGIDLEPITKIYKKGEMPSSNDFLPAIDAYVGSDIAYVSSVSPTINPVLGDIVYSVTVILPEKEPEKYTITYETNGGSAVASQLVEERAAMLPPSNPTRTGYTFAGWYYEADLVTPVSWDREMPSMNFTLYAKWTANNYKITFDAGEGTATGTSLDVTYDKTLGALPTATRPNYIFLGWYTAASGGTQYTADTVYKNTSNITLYAHWQIKATIASSNVTITDKTTTYNGSGVTLAMSNNLGLDMSSFTVSYKRQELDRNWSTDLPVNAGTYDVRIQRAEDDKYLACEHTYTGKLVINKASRTISSSGLTATVVGGNISVTSVPSYPGDGQQMFALGSDSFGTSGGFTNLNGTYQVKFYVAEGENYLASNTVSTGNITVGTPYQPIDMKPTYKVDSYTQDELGGGTSKTVKVWLIHTDGSESSKTSLSNIDNRGDSSTDTLYPVYDDPWKLYRIKYQIDGSSNDWDCGGYKLYAVVNGSSKTLKSEGSNGSSELFMLDNSASHYRELGSFKRNITGVGNFSGNVNLSLSSSDGLYTFTYNGTVVDQYESWSTSGSGYNAFYHTDAPTLTLSCSNSTINGFNYAQYFRSNLDTITIDRAGLYKAMIRDGVTSISATATLSFNSGSTASGNTWTKTFNISLPATASVSEGMDTYYSSGEGNVTVQTQEDEAYLYVTMGLNSNPGIWGIKNTVAFDTTALELISETKGSLASDYEIKTTTADGKYTLLAYRDGIKESYATGSFVTLTFKKKVETVDPDTAIILTNDQTIDDKAQAVNVDSIFNVGDFTSVPPSDENQYLTDADTIVDTLHAGFGNKNTATQTFYYKTTELVTEETLSGWFHTAKDRLSRYDSFGIKRYAATASKYTKNSEFYYTITYTVEYYLTADQEIALDTKIGTVLNGLNLSGKTDLEKVTAIYAYLCDNVVYDENATNCFTAYGALLDGRAVCQGYALAMMRLLNAVDVETDVVLGTSSEINHMWNVVKLDGEYFLLDATWDSDSEEECYAYFLKGSDDFANHTPTESYTVTLSADDHEKAYVLSHSFASTWSYDNTNHWYDCANCDAVNEKTAHTDSDFDHACDGGCDIVLGEHKDDNKDHICDYGCNVDLVAPTYVVTIPATVNEGEELTISANGVVLYDTEVLTVTVSGDFTLKTAEGAQLPYTLGGLTDGAVALAVTGNGDPAAPVSDTKSYKVEVAEEAKYSGTYTGTVTFTIAVNTAEQPQ